MPKNKLKTPDWILKGETKPKKKTGKTFKIRRCPKCDSDDVGVVIGSEKGEWECRKCKWKGTDVQEEKLSEEEFMKYMDEMAPKGVHQGGARILPRQEGSQHKTSHEVPSMQGDINIEGTLKSVPSVNEDVNTEGKDKKPEPKKPVKTKPKVKRDYAVVNAKSLPISTKHSMAICRFIKNKKIETAIEILEDVLVQKKAVPMKGEIPHRKGAMMSGRYPQKAVGHFIKLLKNLEANAIVNELDEPVIVEAIANLAQRPYGRFGRTKKKRTHVKIKCVEKKEKKK